jgi:hypothetical protein
VLECADEESAGSREIPLLGDQNIDHLPELVDRPVQISPPPSNLDVGLITNQRSPGACRHGRAASINNGAQRCTHRKTVT